MFVTMLLTAVLSAATGGPVEVAPERPLSSLLEPPQTVDAILTLRAGESVDLAVLQEGIDVVVEAFAPDGTLVDTVDSPNGRQGDEPLSLFAAAGGRYRLHVRPISASEPRGRITIRVVALRDAAQTRRLLAERRRAREEAAAWLRPPAAALLDDGSVPEASSLTSFDELAADARVVGLGEATHGSRELNDLRLALVERLVERHGYRLIGLEDSVSRWRALEPYVQGDQASASGPLEWGWIGRRVRRELLDWVRRWNLEHRSDRVAIVGLDPQDNRPSRELLGPVLERAYGETLSARWRERMVELEAADEQTAVFGDSGTSPGLRQFLIEVVAQLESDGPLLRRQLGDRTYEDAVAAAADLAAFADFNSGSGAISHSRDRYMASNLLRAVDRAPAHPRAVLWAHNAHVSTAATRWGPTGALLRQAVGCGYRAVAVTFGQGSFVAQVPNDPEDRLLVNRLPAAGDETVEQMLASVSPGAYVAAWECETPVEATPAWLRSDRPMRWGSTLRTRRRRAPIGPIGSSRPSTRSRICRV